MIVKYLCINVVELKISMMIWSFVFITRVLGHGLEI